MRLLIIGVSASVTPAVAHTIRDEARALLPAGWDALVVGGCTTLAVLDDERGRIETRSAKP